MGLPENWEWRPLEQLSVGKPAHVQDVYLSIILNR